MSSAQTARAGADKYPDGRRRRCPGGSWEARGSGGRAKVLWGDGRWGSRRSRATLTHRISIGNHARLELTCTNGHTCGIDDFCTIFSGVHAASYVYFETGGDVGLAWAIVQGLTGRDEIVVSGGAVAMNSAAENRCVLEHLQPS